MPRGRLLIVDDDLQSIEILVSALEDHYDIHFALDGAGAVRQLQGGLAFDLLLLDIILPDTDGYCLLEQLQQQEDCQLPPVIFITGLNNAAAETRGLELGAIDYITKPINPVTTRARVRNHIRTHHTRQQLERLAMSDALTGLSNRRHFDQTLRHELSRCAHKQQPISLILLDIDHFKLFNDHYGHAQGDHCLRSIAGALQQTLSHPMNIVARIGGEEFACLLPAIDQNQAAQRAQSLLQSINQLDIPHAGSLVAHHVTVSIGVATLNSIAHQEQAHQLFHRADCLLYQAKEWGRNRVVSAPSA